MNPRWLRRLAFLLVVTLVFGLLLIYAPLRLVGLLLPEWSPGWALPLALFLLPFGLRLLHEQIHHPWSRYISAVIMTWVGVCFVAVVLLLPVEALLTFDLLSAQLAGQIVIVALACISIYSIYNAHRLHVRVVDINSQHSVAGLKLAQISDVHIGSRQPGFLKPIVERVNQLNADYVMITGDLVDMRGITEADLAPLGQLNAPSYFCIGNHERYVDVDDICQRLRNHGIVVLRNESIEVDKFQLLGIDDAEARSQVGEQIRQLKAAPDRYRILLYHRPDGYVDAADWGVHLMLTGHTHRGQIFPFNFLVKRVFNKYYRLYRQGDMTLYVSPGTGTWGPVMRLGSKCEITLFRLL